MEVIIGIEFCESPYCWEPLFYGANQIFLALWLRISIPKRYKAISNDIIIIRALSQLRWDQLYKLCFAIPIYPGPNHRIGFTSKYLSLLLPSTSSLVSLLLVLAFCRQDWFILIKILEIPRQLINFRYDV